MQAQLPQQQQQHSRRLPMTSLGYYKNKLSKSRVYVSAKTCSERVLNRSCSPIVLLFDSNFVAEYAASYSFLYFKSRKYRQVDGNYRYVYPGKVLLCIYLTFQPSSNCQIPFISNRLTSDLLVL